MRVFQTGDAALIGRGGPDSYETHRGLQYCNATRRNIEAARVFSGLADGREIGMPLHKTFSSPWFRMLTNRYGTAVTVNVLPAQ